MDEKEQERWEQLQHEMQLEKENWIVNLKCCVTRKIYVRRDEVTSRTDAERVAKEVFIRGMRADDFEVVPL